MIAGSALGRRFAGAETFAPARGAIAMKTRFLLSAIALCSNASADDIRPGLWKISLEARVEASPEWQPEAFALTQCLTESDARDPARLLANWSGTGVSGCEFFDQRRSPGRLAFAFRCSGDLGVRGRGEVAFAATSLEGTLDADMGEAEKVDVRSKLRATYLGPCPNSGTGSGGDGVAPEDLFTR